MLVVRCPGGLWGDCGLAVACVLYVDLVLHPYLLLTMMHDRDGLCNISGPCPRIGDTFLLDSAVCYHDLRQLAV